MDHSQTILIDAAKQAAELVSSHRKSSSPEHQKTLEKLIELFADAKIGQAIYRVELSEGLQVLR